MATNPHIYVSSVHGTNTGGSDTSYATQQTGNITSLTASNVYSSFEAALQYNPSSGDFIYVCDNHSVNGDSSSNWTVNQTGGNLTDVLNIISVDSTNIDTYKAGATEINTNAYYDINIYYPTAWYGMTITNSDNGFVGQGTVLECIHRFVECTLEVTGATDQVFDISTDAGRMEVINCTIVMPTGGYFARVNNMSIFRMTGGALTGQTPATNLFIGFGAYAGAEAHLTGVDLSTLTTQFIPNLVAGTNDRCLLRVIGCQLNSSVTLPTTGTALNSILHRFEMFNCDDSSGGELARFYIADGCGSARSNASVYNSNNPAFFDGTTKSSIEVRTVSYCNIGLPFQFEVPTQYIDFSTAATSKVTVNLVTNMTLTHSDITAFMDHPDGTTEVLFNAVDSGFSPLGGATLSTSSLGASDWTGEPASPNFYKLELDTAADAGSAWAPTVRIEVYNGTIDGTTNKLFIDPVLEVGT